MAHLPATSFDPVAWAAGLLGTLGLGWIGVTSNKVNKHSEAIAEIKTDLKWVKKSLNRIEDHLGTKQEET